MSHWVCPENSAPQKVPVVDHFDHHLVSIQNAISGIQEWHAPCSDPLVKSCSSHLDGGMNMKWGTSKYMIRRLHVFRECLLSALASGSLGAPQGKF